MGRAWQRVVAAGCIAAIGVGIAGSADAAKKRTYRSTIRIDSSNAKQVAATAQEAAMTACRGGGYKKASVTVKHPDGKRKYDYLCATVLALGTASTTTTRPAPTTTVAPTTTRTAPPASQAPTTAPPAPAETAGQANARRSAQQYLRLGTGFSRDGLIQQLSSPYGEGFSVADATYGVDATNTDWNAQACLSAKNYLKFQPFSHAGLVQQLSSPYGEKFTLAQAEYGVTCAGL